jgi:transposase
VDPRRNGLLKEGSKSDKVDAHKFADWLRTGMLRPVYHGENGLRPLRELGRSYQTISRDLTRVMNRLKALYRGWGIPCAGTQVYAARSREEWLSEIPQAGVRRRAELLYQQLDGLQALRRNLRPEFLAESRKHKASKLLRQTPCIGPIRAARLIGPMQTPHRFRSKRELWTYSGLGIVRKVASRGRDRFQDSGFDRVGVPGGLGRRRHRMPLAKESRAVREKILAGLFHFGGTTSTVPASLRPPSPLLSESTYDGRS